jgi:hypothetical protein
MSPCVKAEEDQCMLGLLLMPCLAFNHHRRVGNLFDASKTLFFGFCKDLIDTFSKSKDTYHQ